MSVTSRGRCSSQTGRRSEDVVSFCEGGRPGGHPVRREHGSHDERRRREFPGFGALSHAVGSRRGAVGPRRGAEPAEDGRGPPTHPTPAPPGRAAERRPKIRKGALC